MMATPELVEFVYNQTMKAIDAYNEGKLELTKELQKQVRNTIDSGDVKIAEALIEKYNIV